MKKLTKITKLYVFFRVKMHVRCEFSFQSFTNASVKQPEKYHRGLENFKNLRKQK